MPRSEEVPVLSGIPVGFERPIPEKSNVCLLDMIDILTEHLNPALCQTVFQRVRKTERERKWTFPAIAQFWAAMIVRHPTSLRHGLDETRKKKREEELWPRVMAEPQSFFQKCAELRADFFEALFTEFTGSLQPTARPVYASWMEQLRVHFPQVQIIDGSKLDAICHRLKLLWPVRVPVLPGCVTVVYDLFTGMISQAYFSAHSYKSEWARAPQALEKLKPGTLLLGDRLYGIVKYFPRLAELKAHGLFRLNGTVKVKRLEVLSTAQDGRTFCEDVLVEVGCGVRCPKVRLRLIRYRHKRYSLDLLTDVLDPEKLPASTAVQLYGMRWSIERMFLDLKRTLKLHSLYASHPNLVAQQFFAAAMVYNAFRVAQGGIAAKAGILPEQLSSEKLFPKLAQAANDYCIARYHAIRTAELNPGITIRFPDLRTMPTANTRLNSILAQRRSSHRRILKSTVFGGRAKSFAQIKGGPTLLRTVSDG